MKVVYSCFTGAGEYSFTDLNGQFITDPLEVDFSIPTDSIALEGNETFCINATLLDTFPSVAPETNEFVADPLIVIIQDVNGILSLMD